MDKVIRLKVAWRHVRIVQLNMARIVVVTFLQWNPKFGSGLLRMESENRICGTGIEMAGRIGARSWVKKGLTEDSKRVVSE